MKLNWSQIEQAQVRSCQNQQMLGKFKVAFIHPETGQFLAFLLGFAGLVTPSDIERWGRQNIQVPREALIQPGELIRLQQFGYKHCLLNSKSVLSKSGRKLGKVRDFTLDTQTNRLLQIHVAKGFLVWTWSPRVFTYQQIYFIGPKLIHLKIEPEATEKTAETKRALWRRLFLRSI